MSVIVLSVAVPQTLMADGRILVSNDDWIFRADGGFSPTNGVVQDTINFAQNVAAWFAMGSPGNFLARSDHVGLIAQQLEDAIEDAGHEWTVDPSLPFDVSTLSEYDALFFRGGGLPADWVDILTQYVQNGGSVYVMGGTSSCAACSANFWEPFLNNFGLDFEGVLNGLIGSIPIDSTHPLFAGVDGLYHVNGVNALDMDPVDPRNYVAYEYMGNELFTVFDGSDGFLRGDSDGNGVFNALADGLHLLTFGFLGGPPPPCLEASDADGDATQNALADALYILTHGFLGGAPPPAPYASCGSDPDPANSLGCDVSTCP